MILPFLLTFGYNVPMAKKQTYTRYVWFIDRASRGKQPNTTKLMEKFEISLATGAARHRVHALFPEGAAEVRGG